MTSRKLCLFLTLVIHSVKLANQCDAADTPPNVLIILADDLGFSDLGCYGGSIETPHLDELASHGLRYSQFYNTARCWPTRAALQTGYYAQQVRRDVLPGIKSGNRGTRPDWAPLLPNRLKAAGYRSYHSGKWHIDGMPLANGFDHSYYLKDQSRFFNPQQHWQDDVQLPAVELGSDFYGTIAVANAAIKHLENHAQQTPDQPFYQYVAFAAPHFPLHALPEDIAKYHGRYLAGWGVERQRQWERIQKLGLFSNAQLSAVEKNIGPPYHFPESLQILGDGEVNRPLDWETLTAQQQEFQATKMAIHAAMVDRMDQEIGRILKQLKVMDAYENTLILFLSDNGASAEIMVRADGHDSTAEPGSAATYLCLGPGWSNTSNTPFRRHKTWVHEGGISTPLIAHWPQGIQARGEWRHAAGHVIDIVPTVLELAQQPAPVNGYPSLPGKSLLPTFAADSPIQRDHLWWSHEGNRALRQGDWKIVAAKGDPWELYNLKQDRTETTNLAPQHPEIVERLSTLWKSQQQDFIDVTK